MGLKRYKTWLTSFILASLVSLFFWALHGLIGPASFAQSDLFDAVWETVNENFYDPNFNDVDWVATGERYRPQVAQAASRAEKVALMNEMLGELQTSHTHLYTADEPAYYQLLGIFYPRSADLQTQLQETFPDGNVEYVGIGAVTDEIDGKIFIKTIIDGSPAADAELQVGDQILSVEGQPFHPIQSFVDKADQPIHLVVQSSPEPDSQQTITVTPKVFDGMMMFVDAMADSVQVIEEANKKIGYIHVWSYAGDQYQQQLEGELIYGRLKDADALVLDLRDGWGGSPLTALNLYTARGPSVTNIGRDGARSTFYGQWKKPVVMLVNEGSRSAKEILAYGFQRYEIGPVVGSNTPGAVIAGSPFVMPDGSLLYVAVNDVYVDETIRLEGVGVTPDVVVPFSIAYSHGVDSQKEEAIATALDLLNP